MEASILGLVYHAHAPTAELFDDAGIRDGLPNQLRVGKPLSGMLERIARKTNHADMNNNKQDQ